MEYFSDYGFGTNTSSGKCSNCGGSGKEENVGGTYTKCSECNGAGRK